MTPKAIINDFHYFMGTLLFVLFALVLLGGPAGSPTASAAMLRAGLSGVLLVLSLYVLRSGQANRNRDQLVRRPVIARAEVAQLFGRRSRASAA